MYFTASSLQSGSTYNFKVESRNLVGYSLMSNTATILAAKPPDVPINFANNALLTTQTQIGLNWDPAIYNGGSAVIDY